MSKYLLNNHLVLYYNSNIGIRYSICNFRPKNEMYYGIYCLVVFPRSRKSFPEAVRVYVKYIYIQNVYYIFAERWSAWAKLVVSQANVSCLDRSDRQKLWGLRVALPFASYLIFHSPFP